MSGFAVFANAHFERKQAGYEMATASSMALTRTLVDCRLGILRRRPRRPLRVPRYSRIAFNARNADRRGGDDLVAVPAQRSLGLRSRAPQLAPTLAISRGLRRRLDHLVDRHQCS